ncbi:MAG: TIGR03435 family protein [Bryobacteraceae bacterium]
MVDTRFDITAKIPPGTTKEQFRLMQQNLLAERFKLTVHHEKKESQVYELTVGKNGPKLKESAGPETPLTRPPKWTIGSDGLPVVPQRQHDGHDGWARAQAANRRDHGELRQVPVEPTEPARHGLDWAEG